MQYPYWASITAGVSQDSILFADNMSLFPVVHNLNTSMNILNEDLNMIDDWATQWKMSLNPDPTKKAQEVIFSRKIKKPFHTPLNFNSTNVKQTAIQKHLGLILDSQLRTIFIKANQTITSLSETQNTSILNATMKFLISYNH